MERAIVDLCSIGAWGGRMSPTMTFRVRFFAIGRYVRFYGFVCDCYGSLKDDKLVGFGIDGVEHCPRDLRNPTQIDDYVVFSENQDNFILNWLLFYILVVV